MKYSLAPSTAPCRASSRSSFPGMVVIRPCDANETSEAYRCILALDRASGRPRLLAPTSNPRPHVVLLSERCRPGAHLLLGAATRRPEVIFIGAGSEVHLCGAARELLAAQGIGARVVSAVVGALRGAGRRIQVAYKKSVLPSSLTARVTVEEASPLGWDRYAGRAESSWVSRASGCRRR
jgi:transketolase